MFYDYVLLLRPGEMKRGAHFYKEIFIGVIFEK